MTFFTKKYPPQIFDWILQYASKLCLIKVKVNTWTLCQFESFLPMITETIELKINVGVNSINIFLGARGSL